MDKYTDVKISGGKCHDWHGLQGYVDTQPMRSGSLRREDSFSSINDLGAVLLPSPSTFSTSPLTLSSSSKHCHLSLMCGFLFIKKNFLNGDCFDVDHFKNLNWICYNMISVLHSLQFWLKDMWDLISPTRVWTHMPCTGNWSLTHWTTREVPCLS